MYTLQNKATDGLVFNFFGVNLIEGAVSPTFNGFADYIFFLICFRKLQYLVINNQ